jgi:AcrR family transcriptional regulator
MPRPKKTAEEIAEMRERILVAAMDLLEEAGTIGLSIRKIGKKLGVSHMVLYTYFESRNAVVEALKARWMKTLAAKREAALQAAQHGDALAVLYEALARLVRLAHEHPRLYDLAWVYTNSDELAQDRSAYTEGYLAHLAHLIDLCIERGQCVARDPRLAAAMALCIANSPHVLYRSERLTDKPLYAQLEPEALQAAIGYLTLGA